MGEEIIQNEWIPAFTPASDVLEEAVPSHANRFGYHGLPIHKRPLWKWQISEYFFFEGISSGAYVISTAAELFGNGRYERMV